MKNSAKKFEELLVELQAGGLEPQVVKAPEPGLDHFNAVFADSRQLTPGSIFCAISGHQSNGHRYLPQLFNRQILALVEDFVEIPADATLAAIRVRSTRAAWAQLASFFCDHPHTKLQLIGITGTNGKTSTVWMIHELLMAFDIRSASIGTLGFFSGRTHLEGTHTTPDPDVLYPFLADLVINGYTHVTMEVSSHSLVQGKLHPIRFDAAGFTSFSLDHLDFHGTMDAYLDAKCLLFTRHLKESGYAIFHESLLNYPQILGIKDKLASRFRVYGSGPNVDTRVLAKSDVAAGHSLVEITTNKTQSTKLSIPMIGEVFAENFTCAVIAASHGLSMPHSDFYNQAASIHIRPVPGRLEPVHTKQTPCRPVVYVDYAHTPDALEKAILNLSGGDGRVITIFGCGGDRDKSKRPLMGAIAAKLSDLVFVTSDNPRNETPASIIQDIIAGAGHAGHVHTCIERDEAIRLAVKSARYRDIILLAGKGHESYQQIGETKRPFSDQDTAQRELSRKLHWLVLGAGQSGSASMHYLLKKGQQVTLTDDNLKATHDALPDGALAIHPDTVKLEDFDKVVISPGVPFDHDLAARAKSNGLEILTEIDLGLSCFRGEVLGVTGTNGKSTTVAMIDFALKSFGRFSAACGNIGIPPTTLDLEDKDPSFTAVLELSSYQLEGCLPYQAKGVAITSFSNDHLARHKTMEAYFAAKWKLTKWLKSDGILVISRDVAEMLLSLAGDRRPEWPQIKTLIVDPSDRPPLALPNHVQVIKLNDSKVTIANTEINFNELEIQGVHNQMNAVIAGLLAQTIVQERSMLDIMSAIAKFRALPFRCEVVVDRGGFKIINDSKSTNLESTLAALSMAQRPAILLMGGQGKGEPYKALSKVQDRIKVLLTFGASGAIIAADAPENMQKQIFVKMEDAVLTALQLARKNSCDIIFSPGCASFDQFRNFEHRGQAFNQLIDLHMNKHES